MKKKNQLRWSFFKKYKKEIENKIKQVLKEDIGSGDITSQWIFPKDFLVKANILAKENGIVAGLKVAEMVFKTLDKKIKFKLLVKDGSLVKQGKIVATAEGSGLNILAGERTALNFLQRMSGIATLTYRFVQKVKGTKAIILDTRKTAPGLRLFDKWAVVLGGGQNHRLGLYDMVLIKDNHIKAVGGIKKAIALVKKKNEKKLKIEVEVENFTQLREALEAKVDRIMLDNMSLGQIKKAVVMTKGRTKLEVSGKVNLDNVSQIAKTGVDYISIGALTHSPKALDISLEINDK